MQKHYLSVLLLLSAHSLSAMDVAIAVVDELQEETWVDPEVNKRSAQNRTPLNVATTERNAEQMRLLLEQGANSEAKDPWIADATPLQALILSMQGTETDKDIECIKILLARKVSIECNTETHSKCICPPLFLAAQCGLVQTVQLLLEAGANPARVSCYGGAPLFFGDQFRLPPSPEKSDTTHTNTKNEKQEWTAVEVASAHRAKDPERYDRVIELLNNAKSPRRKKQKPA